MSEVTRCGYIAIIGRPNVGKSTLLNHILGQKISITSRKPQTTRHRILGIKTDGQNQMVFIDTPGVHREAKKALNRYMNRTATSAIHDVDMIVFVVEALQWQSDDEWIFKKIRSLDIPIIVAINKVDKVTDKERLLPYIEKVAAKFPNAIVLPLSALKNDNIRKLEEVLEKFLPENPHFFPDDQVTDVTERFMASEVIREKLMKSLGQELPYALTVQIEEFTEEPKIIKIGAIIWTEKTSHKSIIIGKEGQVLKKVGTAARSDLETYFAKKVFLRLWVKVKESWSDNERALHNLGYRHDE